ncbi:MAG: hypothetical protein R3321_10840 [Nitrososphaeraceae archaeon]|nr:hypothetical protein [Nitrososphaeraceae archaeon]
MGSYSKERDKKAEKSRQIAYDLLNKYEVYYQIIDTNGPDNGMDLIIVPENKPPIIVDLKSTPIIDCGQQAITVNYSYGDYKNKDKYFKAPPNYPSCKTDLFIHTPLNGRAACYWVTDMRYSKYYMNEKARVTWRVPKSIKEGCITYVVARNAVYDLEDWLSGLNNGTNPKPYIRTGQTPRFLPKNKIN